MLTRTLLLSLVASSCSVGEERTYTLTIDKPAGRATVIVATDKDGSVSLHWESELTNPQVKHTGTETWKGGRLVRLETTQGKKSAVSLVAGREGYALKAGAKEVTVRGDVWPSSYWLRPEVDKALLVDTLNGEVVRAKVEKIGVDRFAQDGRAIIATRYRVTAGGQATDLWYDAKDQLLRRVWVVDGKKMTLELTRIQTK